MQFAVSREVFERFPGMRIVVVIAEDVDNRASRPTVEAMWGDAWAGARLEAQQFGNAQSHPRVQPWRDRFTSMGVSGKKFPSSVEALVRRALKDDVPFQINPLVDFYNSISLRHVVPAGAFDLRQLHGPFELRLTRPGDQFTALDADAPEPIDDGEVAYVDGSTVLTRHFVWRQARVGLVSPDTGSVVLLAEVLGEVGPDVAERVADDFREGLARHFAVQPRASFVVGEHQPAVEW